MKGRTSNTCRANGGGVRDIGGYKAPSYGTDAPVLKAAEDKTVGMIPDGEGAKPRLDRPGRKHGGSVMKHHMMKDKHHEKEDHKKHGGHVKEHEEHKKDGGKTPHFLEGIKKGALRSSLHVKEGEKIPEKKLEKAAHSDNPVMKKRAVLAENMRHWAKGGKKD